MGRQIRIGRVVGAPVIVSPWWFVIAAALTVWVAPSFENWLPDLGTSGEYLLGAGFVLILYASAFLHELGHAFSGRAFGLRTHRIELTALGGHTDLDAPRTPTQEAAISFAGPAVNLVLIGVAVLAVRGTADDTLPHLFAAQLLWTNVILAGFNLLPGLPLDGGGVLRALVWRVSRRPGFATIVAAWCGRVVAVGMGLWVVRSILTGGSLLGWMWMLLVAGWIWSAGGAAISTARARERVPALSARRLARPAITVVAEESVAQMMARIDATRSRGAVVVDSAGRPTGVVSEGAVTAAPRERWPWIAASTVARRLEPGLRVDASLAGEDLMHALAHTPASEYLVAEADGTLVGVLAFTDIEAALDRR